MYEMNTRTCGELSGPCHSSTLAFIGRPCVTRRTLTLSMSTEGKLHVSRDPPCTIAIYQVKKCERDVRNESHNNMMDIHVKNALGLNLPHEFLRVLLLLWTPFRESLRGLAKEPPRDRDARWRGTYCSVRGRDLVLDEEVPIISVKKEFNDRDGLVRDGCCCTKAAAPWNTMHNVHSFIMVTIVVVLLPIKRKLREESTFATSLPFSVLQRHVTP